MPIWANNGYGIQDILFCMLDAHVVEWIREKYVDLAGALDERGRRRWAAIEARSLGHAGVAEAIGMSDRTI